jgi:DNA-binding transcriptional regulator PaaX
MELLFLAMTYSDRIVFDYLASLATDGQLFSLCYVDIATATGTTHRTARRAIVRLVRAGFISCERTPGRPHTYKVNHHGNRPQRESA